MINILTKDKLESQYKELPIKYYDYLDWLGTDYGSNEEYACQHYYYLFTRSIKFRPRREWDEKGPEIYDADKLSEHVGHVVGIIKELKLKKFIIEHEYGPILWFPKGLLDKKKPLDEKLKFVQSISPLIDVNNFEGGFYVENSINDIEGFIRAFVDYPFFGGRDIDIISTEIDLVIKIFHHLDIVFITRKKVTIERIINLLRKTNLKIIT
ncbi:hypothetical protein ACFL2A_03595 [Thermodesulfobacteriota bacterium]